MCDHVLIIRKGKFVVCDTPEDLEEKLSARRVPGAGGQGLPEEAAAVLDRVSGVTAHTLLGQTEDASRFSVAMDGDVPGGAVLRPSRRRSSPCWSCGPGWPLWRRSSWT